MLVVKPTRKLGGVHKLDSTGKSVEVQNLAELPGGEDLLQGIDNRPLNNPDNAQGQLFSKPGVMQGHPQGQIRQGTQSGGGTLHPTAQTSAPKSKPSPSAAPVQTPTRPMSNTK